MCFEEQELQDRSNNTSYWGGGVVLSMKISFTTLRMNS